MDKELISAAALALKVLLQSHEHNLIIRSKNIAVRNERFEDAARLRDEEDKLLDEMSTYEEILSTKTILDNYLKDNL